MRSSLLILLISGALATAGCHRPQPAATAAAAGTQAALPPYAVRFERTPCMGKCPTYTVEIKEDGTFTYEGGRFAFREGTATGQLSKLVLANIRTQARAMEFAKMPADAYGKGMTDAPSAILTIVEGKGFHTVTCVGGECPAALKGLQAYLDAEVKRALGAGPEGSTGSAEPGSSRLAPSTTPAEAPGSSRSAPTAPAAPAQRPGTPHGTMQQAGQPTPEAEKRP